MMPEAAGAITATASPPPQTCRTGPGASPLGRPGKGRLLVTLLRVLGTKALGDDLARTLRAIEAARGT